MSEIAPSTDVGLENAKRLTSGYGTYVLYIFFAINFLNYLDRYVLIGAANIVGKELHFNIAGIGLLSSAFLIFFTLTTIPFGIWADRAKRKDVIAFSVAVWSLATVFTALAGNFIVLLISRMVLGTGEAGYGPASNAMLADYFKRSKRSQVLSRLGSGALIGVMFGIIIGGVVAGLGTGAWRWAFVFTGIPGLLLAFLAWRLREPRRNQADEEAGELLPETDDTIDVPTMVVPKKVLGQLGTLIRIKTLVVLTVMFVFASFVLAASATYLPTLFQQKDSFGLSSAAAGLFSGIGIAVAGVAGAIFGGYMSDVLDRRYPGARVLVCGLGFLIGAPSYILSVIVGVGTHNIYFYSIFFFSTTLLLNMYIGPSGAATQDVVPSALRASAAAVVAFVANLIGNAFAPTLVGILAAALDPTHGQHFAHNMAGNDLALALCYTCPPALVIAGLVAIFGARWVKSDMLAAQRAEKSSVANT